MSPSRRAIALLAVAVVVAGAVAAWQASRGSGDGEPAPPGRQPVAYGISGENPSMFADPRFAQLRLSHARVQVSWDLAVRDAPALTEERDRLSQWLRDARAAGITDVLLAVKSSRADPAQAPSDAEYADGVSRLLAWFDARRAGDLIHSVSAWNEPNIAGSTKGDPVRAAAYYGVVRTLCRARGCTPVAGEFSDHGLPVTYLRAYRDAIGAPAPTVWAWHAYEDAWDRAQDASLPRLRAFLRELPAGVQVWLDEQGGIIRRIAPGDDGRTEQDEARADGDLAFLLSRTPALDRRITRFDVYQFQGERPPRWDSGLIAPDGRTRAMFCTFRAASAPADHSPCP